MRTIIVGTRQSALALTQTGQAVELLKQLAEKHGIACQFEIKKIVTKGDRILDVTLSKVGGKGLFVKEIEQALTDGEIDIAVHSMKDMPFELPEGLVIGAIPEREDPRDALITRGAKSLDDLPQGALVGTSSLRRSSQLQHVRPDLRIESLRGNIDSRLRKLDEENFDAILLAAAGLHRIGWRDRITAYLPPEQCLPAVGQGALCIECRGSDDFVLDLLGKFQHEPTALAVRAERAFLGRLNGGCQVPLGAYASVSAAGGEAEAPELTLTGMVGSPDGAVMLKETASGSDPEALGRLVADKLIAQGAERILNEART
ncbi:hydroxymethylbilane synthase [Paenibacillus whitsoniae]|uniref:Porphobilinogen deaminase n=1 Tax=Paenibacillus whitsoniae TaxID=2496558 RepID=A0A3S0A2G6_9BACL|nr:hydroxymethylbilane synthase [Paenibacillus whitsoniae]RTE08021.1 hydroxymethylbilane synthase [Paenibacillus whitsoniae]